jgi:hypothetical protein
MLINIEEYQLVYYNPTPVTVEMQMLAIGLINGHKLLARAKHMGWLTGDQMVADQIQHQLNAAKGEGMSAVGRINKAYIVIPWEDGMRYLIWDQIWDPPIYGSRSKWFQHLFPLKHQVFIRSCLLKPKQR